MAVPVDFLSGEYRRLLDDRFRLSIPGELVSQISPDDPSSAEGPQESPKESKDEGYILAKERPGALSLWKSGPWQSRHQAGVKLVSDKMTSGRLEGRLEEVQRLGRLLSTRHREVQLAGKGRLLIPEGFREFLGVAAGSEVIVIGAAVCLEIWRPQAWFDYLNEHIPGYRDLLENLVG